MVKNARIVLMVFSVHIICGCSLMGVTGPRTITGEWEGRMPRGDNITITFNKDMTLTSHMKGDRGEYTIQAKYRIDYDKEPISIDIYDMVLPQGEATTYRGIVKFQGRDVLVMQGVFQRPGETEARPKAFGDDAIEYRRVIADDIFFH